MARPYSLTHSSAYRKSTCHSQLFRLSRVIRGSNCGWAMKSATSSEPNVKSIKKFTLDSFYGINPSWVICCQWTEAYSREDQTIEQSKVTNRNWSRESRYKPLKSYFFGYRGHFSIIFGTSSTGSPPSILLLSFSLNLFMWDHCNWAKSELILYCVLPSLFLLLKHLKASSRDDNNSLNGLVPSLYRPIINAFLTSTLISGTSIIWFVTWRSSAIRSSSLSLNPSQRKISVWRVADSLQ